MSRAGFTLVEIALAVLILSVGVLAAAESLTRLIRLSGRGRERGRMAVVLESRLDRLRFESRGSGCTPPAAGAAGTPDGIQESWTSQAVGSSIEVLVVAVGPGRGLPDTLRVRYPCG